MKVLLSWLRDFAPFEGDPVALGEELSDLGMAVESLDRLGEGLGGIVVARVLETRPVEGANKIHQVIVDAGDGQPLEIGCGAFNMAAGDLVPLATIGTVMPNGMEIGRRRMAGVWSNGMLCSSRELGLGDDHAGIMILPEHLEPGTPFAEAMGIEADVLYDLEVNPNRPDAMSVAGVARDLAARLRLPFALPDPDPATVPADQVSKVSVEILDPDRCGLFEARVLRGITVGAGDPKLATRLSLMGMRSISNVVDVSNYVMLELGQPNHPYDLAKVAGPGFRVRVAREGETLTTLDDVERTLTPEDLLICGADDVPVPPGSQLFDLELEVAAVIGRPGRDVDPAEADSLIAGYTILVDWSARDLQRREMKVNLGPAKGKDFATTLGPWLVTADELEPYRDEDGFLALDLRVAVNGVEVGQDLLSNMSWPFEELISYASRGTQVRAGDVLGSGTCGNGGCLAELWGLRGRQDPPPLRPGDVVEMTVEGIGTIRNQVVPGLQLPPVGRARLRPRTRKRSS